MYKNALNLMLVLLLVSCGSSRVITSKEEDRKYNNKEEVVQNSPSNTNEITDKAPKHQPKVNTTPAKTTDKVAIYVHKYAAIAQYEMQQSGIPASITLAQGILESGAGNGDLTKRANNHFGIKCHNWTGERVYHDDDKKGECFRKYSHPSESFKDHSKFLTSRGRYSSLFKLNKKDYKGWARGLRKAGYATDPKYPSKLISLIERYQLNQYDNTTVITETPVEATSHYKIVKGDTLYSVARKFNLSVSKLKEMNNLSENTLSIGQQLIVQ